MKKYLILINLAEGDEHHNLVWVREAGVGVKKGVRYGDFRKGSAHHTYYAFGHRHTEDSTGVVKFTEQPGQLEWDDVGYENLNEPKSLQGMSIQPNGVYQTMARKKSHNEHGLKELSINIKQYPRGIDIHYYLAPTKDLKDLKNFVGKIFKGKIETITAPLEGSSLLFVVYVTQPNY